MEEDDSDFTYRPYDEGTFCYINYQCICLIKEPFSLIINAMKLFIFQIDGEFPQARIWRMQESDLCPLQSIKKHHIKRHNDGDASRCCIGTKPECQ